MNNHNKASIISDDNICYFDGVKMHQITKGNMNFDAIKVALLNKEYDQIEGLLNPMAVIETKTDGLLKVEGTQVMYKQDVLPESLTKRLLDIVTAGHTDLTSYLKFMENTYNNPSKNSREELYKFIEHKEMPITEDGCVLGYKGVSSNYMDIHSGKFRNVPGDVNEMPRRDVDDNCQHGCSYGFHVGTKDYADSWAGSNGKLLVVKYDPADAVSVPADGLFEKLRVCRYEVVCEIPSTERSDTYLSGQVYDDSGTLIEASMPATEQTHSDNWYKARNYIETCRDQGHGYITNRTLDDQFGISEWNTEEWNALIEETGIYPGQWRCDLYNEAAEDLTTSLGDIMDDIIDEATSDKDNVF